MWNVTMFVDLYSPLNASSPLSASAELLVYICGTEGTSSKCTLFIGTIGLQYKVFRQAVRRIPKEPPFWLWLR